jgi:hypothetical protein
MRQAWVSVGVAMATTLSPAIDAAGQVAIVKIEGSAAGRPGCPLPAGHLVVKAGPPALWGGIGSAG